MPDLSFWLGEIRAARERLRGHLRATPLRQVAWPDRPGCPIWLKPENRQITGSFKIRGATNAVALHAAPQRGGGIVTASSGNHGRGLAHAARGAGIKATVFVSSLVPEAKLRYLRTEGAEIHIAGASQDTAEAAARAFAGAHGQHFISAFDDPAVIAGQGTLGLEILDELPEVDLVLLPLSGGGLASGVAAAVKARSPRARVVGVTMANGASMHASLRAGHPVDVAEVPTLADGLGGGIGRDNRYTFAMVRDLLDDSVLVSEAEIAAAIRAAAALGETVEGAGAVGLAAWLAARVRSAGPTVIVLSGGNIDPALHRRILAASS